MLNEQLYTKSEEQARRVLLVIALEDRALYPDKTLKEMLGEDKYDIAGWFLRRGLVQMGFEEIRTAGHPQKDSPLWGGVATVAWRRPGAAWSVEMGHYDPITGA